MVIRLNTLRAARPFSRPKCHPAGYISPDILCWKNIDRPHNCGHLPRKPAATADPTAGSWSLWKEPTWESSANRQYTLPVSREPHADRRSADPGADRSGPGPSVNQGSGKCWPARKAMPKKSGSEQRSFQREHCLPNRPLPALRRQIKHLKFFSLSLPLVLISTESVTTT
jgi:hypothetical protein